MEALVRFGSIVELPTSSEIAEAKHSVTIEGFIHYIESMQKDHDYVCPNSMEYQNVVMENKINRHQKRKSQNKKDTIFKIDELRSTILEERYKGQFSNEKLEEKGIINSQSPSRVNDTLGHIRKYEKKKVGEETFAK